MKKYIQINSAGEITSVATGLFLDGIPAGLHEVPVDMDSEKLISEYVYVDGKLLHLGKKPSQFHRLEGPPYFWKYSADAANAALNDMKQAALAHIDNSAGRARSKYITSVPGQAETYQVKQAQAKEWESDGFQGPPPSFIAAEAAAIGVDAIVVAKDILDTANLWSTDKGPSIEAARRKWKLLVPAASSIQEVLAVMQMAEHELNSI